MFEVQTQINGVKFLFYNGLYTNGKTYNVYLTNSSNKDFKMDWVGLSIIFKFKVVNYKVDYIKRLVYNVKGNK